MSTSSACIDSSSTQWMLNSAGRSPCEVLDQVVKVCEASASVPNLSVDVSCGSLVTNASSACCCSTATYALVSACWVCQTNRSPSLLSSTYQTWWSGCPVDSRLNGSLPAVISQTLSIAVPNWALVQPAASDANWNPSSAQLAVGITPSPSVTTSTSPSSSVTSTPTVVPPKQERDSPPYAPIAICSALALVLLLGMAAWLYRRRNRVSPSRPPPDFDLDGGASRGLITQQEHTRPGWAWWRKIQGSQSSRQSQSDPGKIDAYQFDYEPLSGWVPSSGSSGSRNGQGQGQGQGQYDPYRPRRNSDAHLAPRASMDTLGVRGQVSSATLGQYYHSGSRGHTPSPAYGSTHNLAYGRATPSPVPGHTSSPQYTLPPGVQVNHPASFAYGSPQPPTYGQSIPYTYPYAQVQPVPSTSTTSPLSPQYVHSPTRTSHVQSPTRRGEQVLMIPVSQMSPDQIQQLRSQFPDIRVRTKKRRPRHGRDVETDREDRVGASVDRGRGGAVGDWERGGPSGDWGRGDGGDRGRARAGTDAHPPRPSESRPRSWSVPAHVETEDEEWDGRPRNGVELREKYERRRTSRDRVVVISVGGGGGGTRPVSGEVRPGSGGARPVSGEVGYESGTGRRTSRIRGPRERARDAGVRLMGGPPPPPGPILG
ncbi:unnamed protein product [Rhizoctonia solani]|uniref:Transmembrane protein n=1 Tax=Rhizoctonia solani TaxID=456999 RepID=A0A8H3ACG1_9AGAM|nr:unnamed protein product [Rhizoctonia solani]